jgi:Chitobiase/beta-hexosaminidase C-terminal domain
MDSVPGARLPSRVRRRRLLAAGVLAALIPASAQAAVTVTPATSSARFDGLPAGVPVTAELVRNGLVIGSAPGIPFGSTLDVNALPGACWAGFTPQILPGDIIRADGQSTTVQDVSVDAPVADPSGNAVVGGIAPDTGSLTVSLQGVSQTLTSGLNPFSVTFAGTTATGSAQAAFTGGDGGTTIVTSPAGSPSPPVGCPPFNPDAVTTVDSGHLIGGAPVINAANAQQPITISGPTGQGVGPLDASLGGVPGSGAASGHTWSATFQPDQIAAMPDGQISAGVGASGATLGVLKDTTPPVSPTSSPPPGRYLNAPTVSLSSEPGARIHFTVDGSTPTAASPTYTAPVRVGSSSTIRAFATDSVGNAGPLAALAYQLGSASTNPGTSNDPTNPGTKPGSAKPSAARITVLKISKRLSLRKLRKDGLGVGVQLGQGTGAVRFMVYRSTKRKNKRVYRLVASVVRSPSAPRYRTRLNARSLGLVSVGLYRLKVVPGNTRTTLDSGAARTIFLRVGR